jgi:hypothetical protein
LLPADYWEMARRVPPYGGRADPTGNNLVVTHTYPFINANDDGEGNHVHHHKNWSPFLYTCEDPQNPNVNTSKILFVHTINPLHVVELDFKKAPKAPKGDPYAEKAAPVDKDGSARRAGGIMAVTMSLAPKVDTSFWGYGSLRGGTAAQLLPSGKAHLTFFHSVSVQGKYFRTYTFGAYTFSSKPPFRLQTITPLPIMTKKFYTGSFAEMKNRKIDYVTFVMNFFFEEAKAGVGAPGRHGDGNGTVMLSFGAQDREAWMARINIDSLFDIMVPVEDV